MSKRSRARYARTALKSRLVGALTLVWVGAVTALSFAEEARRLGPGLTASVSGVEERLQALSPVDDQIVWASGLGGRWLRTLDGGTSWQGGVIDPGLEIRDIDAFNSQTAWALSSGPGAASRIYRTEDGGSSWALQHRNAEPKGFFDCLAAWSDQVAFVYGDSVDGELRVLRTGDGGKTWQTLQRPEVPAALEGEGGFAASGTCAIARAGGHGWIATGASVTARVLSSSDWGRTWQVTATPAVAGEASGLTSLAGGANELFGAAGRIGEDRPQERRLIRSTDGGRSWSLLPEPALKGPIYGIAHSGAALLIAGPSGVSQIDPHTGAERLLSTQPFWSVAVRSGRAWFAGPAGSLAWLDLALAELQLLLDRSEKPVSVTPSVEPEPTDGVSSAGDSLGELFEEALEGPVLETPVHETPVLETPVLEIPVPDGTEG